jgi:PAS domain S-box-containing protein
MAKKATGTLEQRLRAAVESSPSGLLMIDSTGRVVLVNRAVERMFGYDRQELLGQPVELLVPQRYHKTHPTDRASFFAAPRERAMGAGHELFGRRKDGSEFPVEIGLSPVETSEGLFVLGAIVDISARKRVEAERHALEEQLRQSQKMEALGTLAGGIAHDFRNILQGIIGAAELLRPAAPESSENLKDLLAYAERGQKLVERILRFSRQQNSVRHPIDLSATVEEAVQLLRATLPTSVRIELQTQPGVLRAMADPTAIHQTVMNLATNGAQAMPDGGTLTIRVQPFYARDSFVRAHPGIQEGRYLQLSVRDTGQGMDESVRSRAFEPFFTTKPAGTGTGLGLAVVHAVLQEHGGTVLLESAPGKGTLVRCLLPAAVAELNDASVVSAALPLGRGQRILLVDDEPVLARLGLKRLIALGYVATAEHDSLKALAHFLADPSAFDAVITDLTMPSLSGLALARQIASVRPGLPILLVTGRSEELPAPMLAESGIARVLTKPVAEWELATALAEVFGIPQSTSESAP